MIVAVTLHQGLSTYTSRRGLISADDYNWNLARMKSFATLKAARAVLDVDSKGEITMERPSNRKIRKKSNVCSNQQKNKEIIHHHQTEYFSLPLRFVLHCSYLVSSSFSLFGNPFLAP